MYNAFMHSCVFRMKTLLENMEAITLAMPLLEANDVTARILVLHTCGECFECFIWLFGKKIRDLLSKII